eukprot:567358-Prorocentrum_minimum.AAC.3
MAGVVDPLTHAPACSSGRFQGVGDDSHTHTRPPAAVEEVEAIPGHPAPAETNHPPLPGGLLHSQGAPARAHLLPRALPPLAAPGPAPPPPPLV